MTDRGGAPPGVAGHAVELATDVRVGDAPAEQFDVQEDRCEGIVEFMHQVTEFKAQDIGGGGRREEKSSHK